jgi:hypothetical protein
MLTQCAKCSKKIEKHQSYEHQGNLSAYAEDHGLCP